VTTMRTSYQLTSVLLVVAACQAPTDADVTTMPPARVSHGAPDVSPAAVLKQPKPSLVTTACVNVSDQMVVTETWDNQTINGGQPLTLTLSLKRPQTGTEIVSQLVLGPYDPQPLFASIVVVPYLGAPWDTFQSIGAAASGAFTDTAPSVRQPKTGWPTC